MIKPTRQKLGERQEAVLRYVIDHPHATQTEIADAMGIKQPTVNNALKKLQEYEFVTVRQQYYEVPKEIKKALTMDGD